MNKNELLRAAIEIELEEGQKQGLDILLYDKPYYLPFQLHEIRLGLEVGLDVSVYANWSGPRYICSKNKRSDSIP